MVQEKVGEMKNSKNESQVGELAVFHDVTVKQIKEEVAVGAQKEAGVKKIPELLIESPSNYKVNKWDEDQIENQQEADEIKTNKNKTVKVNSLSALIEHIKMENAKSKGEQYTSPRRVEDIKKSDENEENNETNSAQNEELEEPIARCPTPLQPGSYWYSKQFTKTPEKELPNSSPQEVRNVLASLTSKAPGNQWKTSKANIFEAEPQAKLEEVSVEESSEASHSYSTDSLTETSDDKTKTIESSSTLEDIQPNDIYELKAEYDAKLHNKKPEINNNNDEEVSAEIKGYKNKSENETEKLTDSKTGSIADKGTENMEIVSNEFISEGADEDIELEIGNQMIEISPSDFIKSGSEKKQAVHSSEECVASDCMCYEAIFRQDHPLETSSLKSDNSFGTDSPAVSPKKQPRRRHSSQNTSSLSDGSVNSPSRPSPRRCRIAAKFEQPLI